MKDMTEPTWKRTVRKILGREDDSRFRDPLPPWLHAWRTASFLTFLFIGWLIGYGLMAAFYAR